MVPVRLRQLTVVSDPLAVDKVTVFYYDGLCTRWAILRVAAAEFEYFLFLHRLLQGLLQGYFYSL